MHSRSARGKSTGIWGSPATQPTPPSLCFTSPKGGRAERARTRAEPGGRPCGGSRSAWVRAPRKGARLRAKSHTSQDCVGCTQPESGGFG